MGSPAGGIRPHSAHFVANDQFDLGVGHTYREPPLESSHLLRRHGARRLEQDDQSSARGCAVSRLQYLHTLRIRPLGVDLLAMAAQVGSLGLCVAGPRFKLDEPRVVFLELHLQPALCVGRR